MRLSGKLKWAFKCAAAGLVLLVNGSFAASISLLPIADTSLLEYFPSNNIGGAIELIAGLHDHQLAADPMIALVDRPGESQRSPSGLEVAVHVADRDQPRRRGEVVAHLG